MYRFDIFLTYCRNRCISCSCECCHYHRVLGCGVERIEETTLKFLRFSLIFSDVAVLVSFNSRYLSLAASNSLARIAFHLIALGSDKRTSFLLGFQSDLCSSSTDVLMRTGFLFWVMRKNIGYFPVLFGFEASSKLNVVDAIAKILLQK